MTKQEYNHIRNLAWDILITAKISKLPTDIESIANLYEAKSLINRSKSLYNNTLSLSWCILSLMGYNANSETSKCLAIRILSPMIVIKSLNVKSPDEISQITKLPINIAEQRFKRLKMLLERNAFETSHLETKVLNQFNDWINHTKSGF